MIIRIGTVMKVFPDSGKVQVSFEDTDSSSLPLPLLSFNREYAMPKLGDEVITLHMQNGSSKGVCLGTYYGGDNQPKATEGYRKDLDGDVFVTAKDDILTLNADKVIFSCSYGTISVEEIMRRLERIEELLSLPPLEEE